MSTTIRPAVLFLLLALVAPAHSRIYLQDVSVAAGLDYSFGPKKTYGGPSVADLDDDGYPDLLFTHHDNHFVELYFNERNGKFSKVPLERLRLFSDTHALNAFRYDTKSRSVYFAMSQGGAYGRIPANNKIIRITPDRLALDVTNNSGMTTHGGRGRSTIYLPLEARWSSRSDMLSLNAVALDRRKQHHVAFRNMGGAPWFGRRVAAGYGDVQNWYAMPVDFDNDGVMDVASFETLRFFKPVGGFKLAEVTNDVLPSGVRPIAVVSVAELDFDNDGKWDLYVATTSTGDLFWRKGFGPHRDYLLRNVGGRYVDVTAEAGIPQDGLSRGVTAADMDNDGLIDLVVSKYRGRSLVLRNVGNGRFKALRGIVPPRLRWFAPADGLVSVDYDLDGRVDVVLSEGDSIVESQGGYFRLFRNLTPRSTNHYLLVRVRNSPKGRATPLHAVVRVTVGKRTMMRRVGAPGVSVSVSVIETLHFGLGAQAWAGRVVVTWLDGAKVVLNNVAADRVVTVGQEAQAP